MSIEQTHVFIMGFTQNWSRQTGVERLWSEVRKLSCAKTWVLPPLSWDTNTGHIAGLIKRNAPHSQINIYGYSYGGNASLQLARDLDKIGLSVRFMVLSDAVARFSNWVFPLKLLSLTKIPKLWVPPNVREVISLVQRHDLPSGHDIIAEDSSLTVVHPPILLAKPHIEMDDSVIFHNEVLKVVLRNQT